MFWQEASLGFYMVVVGCLVFSPAINGILVGEELSAVTNDGLTSGPCLMLLLCRLSVSGCAVDRHAAATRCCGVGIFHYSVVNPFTPGALSLWSTQIPIS